MFTISRAGKNEFKMNKRGEMKENRSDRISKLKQDTMKPYQLSFLNNPMIQISNSKQK